MAGGNWKIDRTQFNFKSILNSILHKIIPQNYLNLNRCNWLPFPLLIQKHIQRLSIKIGKNIPYALSAAKSSVRFAKHSV